jgi:DNA-binding NtrC family response regulator
MTSPHRPAATALAGLSVLVLDDEPTIALTYSRLLEREGCRVRTALSIAEAERLLGDDLPDIAIVDVYIGLDDGLAFVRNLRQRLPSIDVVMVSAEDTESLARQAIACGADTFLSKPIAPTALILTVGKLAELRHQRRRAEDLEHELKRSIQDSIFPEILTNCDAMRAVLRLVEKVAGRDLAVLICGESGTGKELCARAIHQLSARARGNFVELNCAALPPNLVESELFGHEKGAFTGATNARIGKIRHASGGTLFLDEIGELPLEIQPKLLRALQEKRIVPVGGKEAIPSDFRLISATNRDLVEEVRAGRFREDLFYRIAVFPIQLPTLRQRMEDLDILLAHFLRQEGLENPRLSPGARSLLHAHHWPGNVRELKNFAQAITLFTDGSLIDEPSVRAYFGSRLETPFTPPLPTQPPLAGERRPVRRLEEIERQEILYALSFCEGNVSEAARGLGMGRATLYKYLKRHGIDIDDFIPRGGA